MTRLGWICLGVMVLGFAAFVSMTSFGGPSERKLVQPTAPSITTPSGTMSEPLSQSTRPGKLLVPVANYPRDRIENNWGDPRGDGGRQHHGTDIMAPANTPVVAAAKGTVEKLFESELVGTTLYLRSDDRRWIYYYAHLAGYAPNITEGRRVGAGQVLGFVGDTGDAGSGNYHLHFGVQRMQPGQRWYQGEDVNPYPMLAAGRRGG